MPANLRAQRVLNHQRLPEIVSYLVENPKDYTLSSLTASVDSKVSFDPMSDTGHGQNTGILSIPMDATILINDGQHRQAAIEKALEENPELGYDNISVLFFIDEGLERSQQMFADLNKHSVRPSDSISTLYDLRDSISGLARYVQENVYLFSRMTELEKSSISNRSPKLVTLSSIKNSSKTLLSKGTKDVVTSEERDRAVEFWNQVVNNMADWQMALKKKVSPSDLRLEYIHAHAVTLQAIGHIGADILFSDPEWKDKLTGLEKIDWSRSNKAWEGRAMVQGRISKARVHVTLTTNYIKKHLGVPLTAAETEAEKAFTHEQ